MKNAFTLAEVLITLGVIGIVAALTMPSLIASYKEKVLISQAKKSLSIVLNAVSTARAKDEVENNGEIFLSSNTSDVTADVIFENMHVVKRCKGYDSNCLKGYIIKQDKARNDGYGNYEKPTDPVYFSRAILADGSIIGIMQQKYPESSCQNYYTTWDKDADGNYILDASGNKTNERLVPEVDCGHIFFDVNGLKAPNQFGADAYLIYVTPYSYVQSTGKINDVIRTNKLTATKFDDNGSFKKAGN